MNQRHVLVVGGGDSALEAAATLAEETDANVTLAYRSAAFSRAKKKNLERVAALKSSDRLRVYMETDVVRIEEDCVILKRGDQTGKLPNDAVIICAGGVLPTQFLKDIGIEIEVKRGERAMASAEP